MADNDTPRYPAIFVTDTGAPEGCVNIHDQATGQTVQAPATEDGYCQAIRQFGQQSQQ